MRATDNTLKLNMFLNAIKGILSVAFPLITFPYVSRVLGVENLGRYNFSQSIVNYFILFAGLGIANYARRDGATLRDNKTEFNCFASEVFSINIVSTIVAYILLIVFMTYSQKAREYSSIIFILSFSIILGTIGVEWIYAVYEDYLYMTIRSICMYLLSIILLFVFVKDNDDLLTYAWISVIASAGGNFLNYLYSKKYCHLKLTSHLNLSKHLKQILVFFASTLSVTIYVNSDSTILGYLSGDYYVGLYSVSVKLYTVIKTLLASAIVVSISRLSKYIGNNQLNNYNQTATEVYNTTLTLLFPAVVGLIIYSKEIILLLSGNEYLPASTSTQILAAAMIAYMFAYFWGQCVMVPNHGEGRVLIITVISALINVLLNLVLIPLYQQNAAALTTFISEGFSAAMCIYYGRNYVNLNGAGKTIFKSIMGCLVIVVIAVPFKIFVSNEIVRLLGAILVSAIVYFIVEILLKNEAMSFITECIRRKK